MELSCTDRNDTSGKYDTYTCPMITGRAACSTVAASADGDIRVLGSETYGGVYCYCQLYMFEKILSATQNQWVNQSYRTGYVPFPSETACANMCLNACMERLMWDKPYFEALYDLARFP